MVEIKSNQIWRIDHYLIKYRGHGLFDIDKKGVDSYVIDLENYTCTCKSWHYKKGDKICKHIKMCLSIRDWGHEGNAGWGIKPF